MNIDFVKYEKELKDRFDEDYNHYRDDALSLKAMFAADLADQLQLLLHIKRDEKDKFEVKFCHLDTNVRDDFYEMLKDEEQLKDWFKTFQ